MYFVYLNVPFYAFHILLGNFGKATFQMHKCTFPSYIKCNLVVITFFRNTFAVVCKYCRRRDMVEARYYKHWSYLTFSMYAVGDATSRNRPIGCITGVEINSQYFLIPARF